MCQLIEFCEMIENISETVQDKVSIEDFEAAPV